MTPEEEIHKLEDRIEGTKEKINHLRNELDQLEIELMFK